LKEITVVTTKNGKYAGVYMNGVCLSQGYLDEDDNEYCMSSFIEGASSVADSVVNVTTKNTTDLPETWPV
jgi:hypothetical protein